MRTELLLTRESGQRLFEQLHQSYDHDRKSGGGRRRPSGEMICHLCGCPYRSHPPFTEEYGWSFSGDWDPRLCDGEVVHL